jgi:hypothetical protein
MKKVKLNDGYIYVDDSKVDEKETGIIIREEDDLEKTQEIEIINDRLSDTNVDIFGENDGK